jgi:glutathione reductase (NADPH)
MMQNDFDLVVIGTGTAAGPAASKCRAAGWSVAVVDSRPFGGTCALRGCDPKKVLVGASEVVDGVRRMQGKGVESDGARLDWADLMRFKRTFVEPVPAARERAFARAGIAAFKGRARFVAPTTIEVDGERLAARQVLVASGAMPAPLRFPGADLLIDSTRFLELESLPRRIAFVGGGYVSMEFGHVARRAGAEVHVVHRGERPLERFDPDLVSRLVDATRALGIEVHLESEVRRVEATASGVRVVTSRDEVIEADLAVHGAGRVPEIDDLDLEAAGIERNQNGVVVNEYLQSVSNPAVYAAGDAAATGAPKLTPVSGMHGHVVASNLLKGNHRKPDHSVVPSIVFTVPPLASVGLSERAARERGLAVEVHHEDTSDWYSSRRVGVKHSAFKVLVERGTDRILGAHVLGIDAEQVINVFTMAIHAKMTAAEIKQTIFAYPTGASDVSYMV